MARNTAELKQMITLLGQLEKELNRSVVSSEKYSTSLGLIKKSLTQLTSGTPVVAKIREIDAAFKQLLNTVQKLESTPQSRFKGGASQQFGPMRQ